jgi:hypothetical protein
MKTDDLILSLSEELPPVTPGAVVRRVILGLGLGCAGSALLMLVWLGVRHDLGEAMATPMFWVKFAYAALTGFLMTLALTRLARPGARLGGLAVLLVAPLVAIAAMGALRLTLADPAMRPHLLMGDSANVCPWRIFVIALPVLGGAVWAMRGLAPTRLPLAGLAAGGCAGGFGAAIYGFHCSETASPFIAIWYTLGMAAVAAVGGLAGSRFLRWK